MAAESVQMIIKLLADGAQFTKTLDDAQKKAKQSAKEIASSISDIAGKAGTAMTLFGTAVTGGLGLAAKAAVDFDSEFAKVTTLLEKEQQTPEFITNLKDGLFDLGKEFGTAMPDNIQAMYDALSSGVPPENVLTFMKDAAIAAKAGAAELGDAVDVTTSIMAAYNMKAEDAGKINDILFAAVKVGKMEYRDLSQYLGQVLPVASAAGVSLEEVSGAIAALTLSGFKPAQAVESLRSMLANVVKPSDDAKKAAAALGVEFNVAALKTKGLQGFMNELFNAMKTKVDWKLIDTAKVDAANKKLEGIKKKIDDVNAAMADPKNAKNKPALTKKLTELQGEAKQAEQKLVELHTTAAEALDRETGAAKLFGDVSGLSAALALGNNNAQNFNQAMDATKNSTGAAAEAFGAMKANDPSVSFGQLKVSVQELTVNIGRFVATAIQPLVAWLTKVIQHVTDWVKNNPGLAQGITLVVGVVGTLALGLGALLLVVGKLAGAYVAFTGMQAALAGGLSAVGIGGTAAGAGATAAGTGAAAGSTGFFALAAGVWATLAPILAVIAVIALVVAALVGLYYLLKVAAESKYGQAFFDWLYSVWEGIYEVWNAAVDWLAGFFSRLVSAIGTGVSAAADAFADLGRAIMDSIGNAVDWALNKLSALWQKLKDVGAATLDFINPFNDSGDSGSTPGNVPGYAKGGIVTRKTLAYVGEAGPEAIIPLRGGGVPVAFMPSQPVGTGSNREERGAAPGNVRVNVYPVPGMSSNQIADEVARVVARRKGMA